MTTDTPRTDEQIWTTEYHHELCDVVDVEFAQQLERELAASQAVVKTLINEGTGVLYKDCCDRRKKAEAEVERLKEQLDKAIEIADQMEQSIDNMFYAGGRVKLPVFLKLSALKEDIQK